MQLLQDVFIVENLQVINEGKTKDTMRIRGVFGRCNEKNNNGRIYPTTVLENQLKKVQPLIQERRLCGELDHPSNDTVKLSNASHLITKLEIKGNELIGEAEILKTPAGLTAKALIDGGVRIGISSRGMGTLSEDAQGNKVVNEDYRLVTFDLVADPSTRGAFPTLAESTQSKFARESQSKLQKESNFVIMLKSKFRQEFKNVLNEERLDELDLSGLPDDDYDYEETEDPLSGRRTTRRISRADQFKDTGSYWGNLRSTYGAIYRKRAMAAERERTAAKAKERAERVAKGLPPDPSMGERIGKFARGIVGKSPQMTSPVIDPKTGKVIVPSKVAPGTERWRTVAGGVFGNLARGFAEKTEYHRIGMILAESMGLLSEEELVKSTKRTGVAATKEKRKDVPKRTVIRTKGSDSEHVATVKTNPGESTVTHEGEKISKSEFKKRLKATGHKFAKVRNPRSLKVESYGDPDEYVKKRKISGDWPGHDDPKESPENQWTTDRRTTGFSNRPKFGKKFHGKQRGGRFEGGRRQIHITHSVDPNTGETKAHPSKTERDKARKQRQERLAANVKKVAGK